jgi:hypothetical protein
MLPRLSGLLLDNGTDRREQVPDNYFDPARVFVAAVKVRQITRNAMMSFIENPDALKIERRLGCAAAGIEPGPSL